MGIFTSFKRFLEMKLNLSGLLLSILFGLMFMNISTFVHEVIGHTVTAGLIGCKAASKYGIFVGVTGYECPQGEEWKGIIIALAGPLAAFILGVWAWFYEEDSIVRVLGLLSFYYSVIPNLVPWIPFTDMHKAVELGLNPLIAWSIYLLIQSLVFYWTFQEITEKKNPFEEMEK